MDFAWLVAEDKIKTALKNGDFDNLPGKGKPQKLEDLSMIPEDLRIAYKVMKNSGYLPEEAELKSEIQSLEELLTFCEDETDRKRLKKRLSEKQIRYNQVAYERRANLPPEYQDKVNKKLSES
ncbi:DnaJ family domain-containing protein [Guptibacillus hwajinpoensis]|uniref:DnaJ family domain-containing protein n=1 Tax=Guptibacillus hwajinpoensis TaxID=208199 RepID=UPI001CFCFC53|nr:DnaJ family domain-containing protein [Pseudalkalibacillus hwajinpoensis]